MCMFTYTFLYGCLGGWRWSVRQLELCHRPTMAPTVRRLCRCYRCCRRYDGSSVLLVITMNEAHIEKMAFAPHHGSREQYRHLIQGDLEWLTAIMNLLQRHGWNMPSLLYSNNEKCISVFKLHLWRLRRQSYVQLMWWILSDIKNYISFFLWQNHVLCYGDI